MEDVELTPESLLLWERSVEEIERRSSVMAAGMAQHYQPLTGEGD